jgi:succinyl-diaminopimelate desuccinylase
MSEAHQNKGLSGAREMLLSAAEKYQAEMTAFLRDLVRIPTVNGRDTEAPLAERIEQEARRLGLDVTRAALQPERPNILVSYGKGLDSFAIIGHMDTVAEGSLESWMHPPFGAQVAGGRIIGRGAADNKAGIACGLYTLAVLRDLGWIDPSRQQAVVAGVVDEESGACSRLGVRHLLDSGALRARSAIEHAANCRGAIYAYTSEIVCIGHRGLVRLEITAHGQSVHAGLAEWHVKTHGANAVMALADLLLRLEALQVPGAVPPGFEQLGFTVTPGTLFQGGSYPSIVPERASALVDMRLLPGQSAGEVLEQVRALAHAVEQERARTAFDLKVLVDIPGASIAQDHPLVTLAQDYTEALTGRRWAAAGAGPANEGYMLIGAGIPTLCGFGPTGGNPHAPDEWVEIRSLPVTTAIFAGIVHDTLNSY